MSYFSHNIVSFCAISFTFVLISCSQASKKKPIPTPIIPDQTVNPIVQIAFGSCNKHDEDQPLWDELLNQKPHAWVWLGDNIYGDTEDMALFKKKYDEQFNQINYAKVRSTIDIYGIWDDHDYGKNNAGQEYKMKRESRDLLFEFIELPKSNGAWNREGAYQSHTIHTEDIAVKLLLIDSRYFREEPSRKQNKYSKEYGPDILGEDQWQWLENELQDDTVDYFILANGIQVIAEDHKYEKWANFPSARERLFNLVKNITDQKVIFLSGDRHLSEVSAVQLEGLPYPLYDITSSGMTHSYRNFRGEENQHRIGDVIAEKNFGTLLFYKNSEGDNKVLFQAWGDDNAKLQELELY
jgi:alkaline phosphatase D